AAELAAAVDGQDAMRAAELRLLDHYLHTGHAACLLLMPATDFGDPGAPAACARAAERGLVAHSWQLPWALAPYLFSQGRWADSAATLRVALAVTERAGDLRGQGHVHYHLAHALDVAGEG